ncbi:MAG TPA: IS110 family transposase [Bryobacteraceae bacterium]|nr:IS110 family transposase [Bryobacteraceae bacterium]
MWIIGCDYHPRFQQIAFVNTEGGECGNCRLEHTVEAEQFYRALQGQRVRVGMEASGHARWFERLLAELGQELWIGDPGKIRAAAPRKQKTDARDAAHLLDLLLNGQFESRMRIWVPKPEERDVRQLVLHRHRLVGMRTRVKNQLRAVALNEGLGPKPGLWSRKGQAQFRALPLPPWSDRRRQDNLELLAELERRTTPLDQAVLEEAECRPEVVLLMTHPGVGPITALTFVLTLSDPLRFPSSGQLASYLGLIPAEDSSGGRQRLGHITKQGNALLRGLLVEAAHSAARREPELRRCYYRLAMRKNPSIAAVAVARKLAIRLWWMWRRGLSYEQFRASGSHAG